MIETSAPKVLLMPCSVDGMWMLPIKGAARV